MTQISVNDQPVARGSNMIQKLIASTEHLSGGSKFT